jgi:hypothetical protein
VVRAVAGRHSDLGARELARLDGPAHDGAAPKDTASDNSPATPAATAPDNGGPGESRHSTKRRR